MRSAQQIIRDRGNFVDAEGFAKTVRGYSVIFREARELDRDYMKARLNAVEQAGPEEQQQRT